MTDKKQITTVSNGLLVLAPAKINLSLLIAGRRSDGFHEIETIMARVTFYDEILIQQGQKAGIGTHTGSVSASTISAGTPKRVSAHRTTQLYSRRCSRHQERALLPWLVTRDS